MSAKQKKAEKGFLVISKYLKPIYTIQVEKNGSDFLFW